MANIQITIPDNKLQAAIDAICWEAGVSSSASNAKKVIIKRITDAMARKKRTDFIKSNPLPAPDDDSDIT